MVYFSLFELGSLNRDFQDFWMTMILFLIIGSDIL